MEVIIEHKKTPIVKKTDVIVIGGGPGGIGAALASARNGAKTVLIERYGFLGGMITSGLVRWWPIDKLIPLKAYGETRPLQGGIIKDFIQELVNMGGAVDPSAGYQSARGFDAYLPSDPEIVKIATQNVLEGAGVEIILHSLAVDVVKEGDQVKGVIVENKSGRQAILATIVIDASGDGDMAAAAGAEYEKVEKTIMTLNASFGNVDVEKAIEYARGGKGDLDSLADQAIRSGDWVADGKKVLPEVPQVKVTHLVVQDPRKDPPNWYRKRESAGWMGHFVGDCTNVNDLTKAELTTRKGVLAVLDFYRKYVPGYENAYLAYTGMHIGIRESRRILGGYLLTADKDIKLGLKHGDTIGKCRTGDPYNLDKYTPDLSPVFDIPYRCIVPRSINGLITAGRCISIDHKAALLLCPRDLCTCVVVGQAAGTAAALSVKSKVEPRDLDVGVLQETLRSQDANLG